MRYLSEQRQVEGRVAATLTDKENADEPEDAELHVVVVDEHVGEVRRQQGVHTSRGAHQVHVGVEHRRAEGARKHAGQVHRADARRPVHHLQRQPDQQLDQKVEC